MPASYERVVGRQVRAAGQAEYDLDALRLQAFHQGIDCAHLASFQEGRRTTNRAARRPALECQSTSGFSGRERPCGGRGADGRHRSGARRFRPPRTAVRRGPIRRCSGRRPTSCSCLCRRRCVARTSTVPAFAAAGAVIVHCVVEAHSTPVAAPCRTRTRSPAPGANPAPVTVTLVPPASGPAGRAHVRRPRAPRTLNTPFLAGRCARRGDDAHAVLAGGVGGRHRVDRGAAASTVKAAGVPPNRTSLASLRSDPVICTSVPPLVGPFLEGPTLKTWGCETNVNVPAAASSP